MKTETQITELDELIETLANKIILCQNELARAWLENQRYLAIIEREEILRQAGATGGGE